MIMSEQKSLLSNILNAIGLKSERKNPSNPGKRRLCMEALEERQLLSVVPFDGNLYDNSVYYGQEHDDDDFHDNDALFFEDIFDEAEIPPDIMDIVYSDGASGPGAAINCCCVIF